MRLFRWNQKDVGLPPGVPVPAKPVDSQPSKISIFRYGPSELEEKETPVEKLNTVAGRGPVLWCNCDGLGDSEVLQSIGKTFSLHDLVIEDIANTYQRPKLEEHDEYLLFVLKMIYQSGNSQEILSEHVCLVLQQGIVLSFQERHGDVFDLIRDRIRKSKGRIRKMGADYLAYALMDAVVDNYFNVMENCAEEIESLESEVIAAPANGDTSAKIHALRRKVILLRRSIWPLREVINSLMRVESALIDPGMLPYFRDLYDHTIQIIETLETFREVLSGLLDIYMTVVSNKMNEVMKVLTIIATIFIPLSFIAGVYGMNFTYMPELGLRWGYFGALGLMATIALGMIIYFRFRKF
ncbi:MAG: magnesium/cobalt transporter CorA [Chitinivibrionales bacterium]|nr:magnesium/cobalt transporter CorA [Chitinivibrionales bacterium]